MEPEIAGKAVVVIELDLADPSPDVIFEALAAASRRALEGVVLPAGVVVASVTAGVRDSADAVLAALGRQ